MMVLMLLFPLCSDHDLVIENNLFPHKQFNKLRWIQRSHQIDHEEFSRKWRTSSLDRHCRKEANLIINQLQHMHAYQEPTTMHNVVF